MSKYPEKKIRRRIHLLKVLCGCSVCGLRDPDRLQFHHLVPAEKEYRVSDMVTRKTWTAIKREIRKCVLLCDEHHRIADRELEMKNGKNPFNPRLKRGNRHLRKLTPEQLAKIQAVQPSRG